MEIYPDLKENEFNRLLTFISTEKRERIKRFRVKSDAQSTLVGDILVRAEICQLMGCKNNDLIFSTNKYGKPYIENIPGVHFNLSHSGHYVVSALSSEPVGIDIETIKPIDIAIAKRFFTQDEYKYIHNSKNGNELTRFYEIWTMKESHIKWEGIGLSKPLNSFSVLNLRLNSYPYYYCILKNNEVVCYTCTVEKQVPVTKHMQIKELLEIAFTMQTVED